MFGDMMVILDKNFLRLHFYIIDDMISLSLSLRNVLYSLFISEYSYLEMTNIFEWDAGKIAYKIRLHLIAVWKADKYRS